MNARVLITCPNMIDTFEHCRDQLEALGVEWTIPRFAQQMREKDLIPIIGSYDGMIAGDDELTGRVLRRADQMRVISKWGVGTDNIDHVTARELGIRVTNTPGVFGDEVADVAVGYLIMLHRGLHLIDRDVRQGEWRKITGRSIAGRTLTVIGLGSIGHQIAKRAVTMGMQVIGVDPLPAARERAAAIGVNAVSDPGAVLHQTDVLCLACPLTPENHHLVGDQFLADLRPGAMLINVSRGGLVDEEALVAALNSGTVASAALDVFETEPLPLASQLVRYDQVILGSHNSSNTLEASQRVNTLAIENLASGLREVSR